MPHQIRNTWSTLQKLPTKQPLPIPLPFQDPQPVHPFFSMIPPLHRARPQTIRKIHILLLPLPLPQNPNDPLQTILRSFHTLLLLTPNHVIRPKPHTVHAVRRFEWCCLRRTGVPLEGEESRKSVRVGFDEVLPEGGYLGEVRGLQGVETREDELFVAAACGEGVQGVCRVLDWDFVSACCEGVEVV